jgi:hypothetical protein
MKFKNPAPLRAHADALDELALDGFPIIDDFALTLADTHDSGKHVEMASALLGRLAGFPGWDHADRDLRHLTPGEVPLGTIDTPFDDREEDWRMLIFEHAGWVYVLEGTAPNASDFTVYFRVPTARYFQAWAALIDTFNPITPLDDTESTN